jgi:aminopeptidase N
MAKVLSRWQSYGEQRGACMQEALGILASSPLSANTREVVEQCLGGPAKA